MTKFFRNNFITKVLDIYVKIIAIIGLLIAAGFVDLSSKVEFEILKPVYVVDLQEFETYFGSLADKSLHDFLNSLRKSEKERFLVVDSPKIWEDKGKLRATTDGNKIFTFSSFAILGDDCKYQLGFPNYDSNFVQRWTEEELKTEEDKRTASVFAIYMDLSRSHGLENECYITNDSLFKLVTAFPDVGRPDKYIPLFSGRDVYNIMSIENPSNTKIENIIVKIFRPFFPTEMKMVGWTFSIEGGSYIDKPERQMEFRLPFLRPKHTFQIVVKTKSYKIEKENVYIEYNKLKSFNKNLIKYVLSIAFLLSLIIFFVEYSFKKDEQLKR